MSVSSPASVIDTGILLEAGTNEAEVLVFRIRDGRYGVNVAKVREVLPIDTITEMPMAHAAVDGLIEVREFVVPLVNLETYLYGDNTSNNTSNNTNENTNENTNDSFILLEFNNHQIAFRVQRVERIFRVSWKDTLPAPRLGKENSPITSILRQDEGLVPMLDFESITASIGIGLSDDPVAHAPQNIADVRAGQPIIFADDSRMVSEMLKDALLEAGFSNLHGFADGEEAWDYMAEIAEDQTPESISDRIACVVSDIEMPRMDGLSFTKRIRTHSVLANVPVILFSSIASVDNKKKGEQVGATAQVSKPNYVKLIETVAELATANGD